MRTVLLLFALFTFHTVNAQNNYKEIALPDLLKKVKEGKDIVILDVRSRGEYNDTLSNNKHLNIGHIKGAINIPLQEITQKPEVYSQFEQYKNKEVYVICSHSYRSRTVSNFLLQKGFTNVNNVQGGMSEWFRDYPGLASYRESLYIRNIKHKNISPEEVYERMKVKDKIQFIGVSMNPRFAFDSMMITFMENFPTLKNTSYYKLADSNAILDLAMNAKGRPVVVFNTIGAAGGEMAHWLTAKGVPNVSYLYGNALGLYEYMLNYRSAKDLKDLFESNNKIQFHTPLSICNSSASNIQFVDMRHDTLFNKVTNGTKLTYKSLKDAVNFPFYKTADDFVKQFPDKKKFYIIAAQQNYLGTPLAKELTERGYSIGWIIGGNERWEWYTNNVGEFKCRENLR